MKFSWKVLGISLGAVVGVLVLAAVLFVAFFPKELAAREAERRIEEATGRDLQLGGKIDISFFPALGFSVEQAQLSNPQGFESDKPFLAAKRIVFAVAVMPLLRGDIEVRRLILDGAEINLAAKRDGSANWTFPTEQTSNQETTIEDLKLDDVRLIDSTITFQGAEGDPPMMLSDVDASLSLASLDQPGNIDAQFTYRDERLTANAEIGLPRAVLEKGETPISAELKGEPLELTLSNGAFNTATGAIAGQFEARGGSLRRLMAWIGSPMEQGNGFAAYRVAGAMRHEGDTTALTNATLSLDQINATGALSLIAQENGRLRVTGALNTATLDLNPYLPAPAQGQGGVSTNTAWSTDPLDLAGLRALDAEISFAIGSFKFQRMTFSNVAMAMRIANGALDARLTRIALYGGSGTARLIADGSQATPRVAVELNAENVQAEPLLTDAIGFDKIVGRGRLQASLIGTGRSQAAIMRSLRGSSSFSFNDGQWKGVNLAQVARMVTAAVSGSQVGAGGGATDFAELSATFQVADGVAATNNLRLLNPYVRLEGAGLIDIGAQTLDMRIAPRAVNNAQGQGGDASVRGIGVPFRISGPWSRVSYRPALEEVAQTQIQQILRQQGGDNPLGALGDALFGRQTTTTTEEAPAETPQQPAQQQQQQQPAQQQRPRNPLEEILRRAQQGQQQEEKQEPAPTP